MTIDINVSLVDTESAGLYWTGHDLVDAGLVTLTILSNRTKPEDITLADLEEFATFADDASSLKSVSRYQSVLFTTNVSFLNPSSTMEKKRAEAAAIFRSFRLRGDDSRERCSFCVRKAIRSVHRDLFPMYTARGVINFAPLGRHGTPICGICITALQAIFIGSPFVSGRSLIITADDPALTLAITEESVKQLLQRVHLERMAEGSTIPMKAGRTRVIDTLVSVERARVRHDETPVGVTAYHFTNSGQGPSIEIHRLPSSVVSFVRSAQAAAQSPAWNLAVSRGWMGSGKPPTQEHISGPQRVSLGNAFYNDLFGLPQDVSRFLRRHLLGMGLALSKEQSSSPSSSSQTSVPLWAFTVLFLREVIGMEKSRIQAIKTLADALAEDISTSNDRRLFDRAYRAQRYADVRRLLIGADLHKLRRTGQPLLSMDEFLVDDPIHSQPY